MVAKQATILDKVRSELARYDKPENKLNYQRFFKEKLKDPMGLKTTIIKKIAGQSFKDVKGLPAKDILTHCNVLLVSHEPYMRSIAFEWAVKIRKEYTRSDFRRFETWLKRYVDNWAACDQLCIGLIGNLLLLYPDLSPRAFLWTRSRNRWLRRAAAVSLIVPVRNGLLLDEVFETADAMLTDADDMVQKGYGWMLKEAANRFPDEVFAYVMKNKAQMPRTALRYAIEKYPPARRKKAMA